MRVSLEWLKRYVDINISPEDLAEKLTMVGLEVDSLEYIGDDIQKVIVGVIKELAPHPTASKLWVTTVQVGPEEKVILVSGAPNLAIGAKVPVALVGATLPGGVEITEVDFRGVASAGMLCSEAELGLAAHSDGIMLLAEDAPVGVDIVDYLGLKDVVLEIELTANRPDCYSMLGVAREVAAILGQEVRYPEIAYSEAEEKTVDFVDVQVEAPNLCPRYMAKVLTGVKVGPSPLWLKTYLAHAGMRSINNVVDITNFVLLEQNQPLHAFDYATLQGRKLVIRKAQEGEELVTLDEVQRSLSSDTLVIADANRSVCIAGVMGGINSEVTETTTTVVLESAWFDQVSIRRTGRNLGLRSEASARFERGLNPEGVPVALQRAAQLMVDLCGAKALKGEIDLYPNPVAPVNIRLRLEKVNDLLGTDLSATTVETVLNRLPGFSLKQNVLGEWQVEVPAYRRDVTIEADLIEEIARLVGYDTLPTTLPSASGVVGLLTPRQKRVERLRSVLVGAGLTEVITYSLTNEDAYHRLGLAHLLTDKVDLAAPLSEEYKFMRRSMLPSLLEVLNYNYKRGNRELAIFELGRIYQANKAGDLPIQEQVLGLALLGNTDLPSWYDKGRPYDFFDLKGVAELVFEALNLTEVIYEPAGEEELFHPGRSAKVFWQGRLIGHFGELHPQKVADLDFTVPVLLGEINIEQLIGAQQPSLTLRRLQKFPASRKDLAVVLPQEISAAEVTAVITKLAENYLEDLRLFDQYTGVQVGNGKKSLAFSMLLRHPERTLNDIEIAEILDRVAQGLQVQFGAELRK